MSDTFRHSELSLKQDAVKTETPVSLWHAVKPALLNAKLFINATSPAKTFHFHRVRLMVATKHMTDTSFASYFTTLTLLFAWCLFVRSYSSNFLIELKKKSVYCSVWLEPTLVTFAPSLYLHRASHLLSAEASGVMRRRIGMQSRRFLQISPLSVAIKSQSIRVYLHPKHSCCKLIHVKLTIKKRLSPPKISINCNLESLRRPFVGKNY